MILSIIIPVFNEEKTVREILTKVILAKLPGSIKKEIIVINDGSKDSTESKIKHLDFFEKIKFFSHKKNLGKGAAIRTGLRHVTGKYILIQDADLEYDPIYYSLLLEPILENRADIVYGTRLMDYPLKLWGKDKTILPIHVIANRFLTGFTNLLFDSALTDMETGYKVFKMDCLNGIKLVSNGFGFEPEITSKLLKSGTKIVEVPIKVSPRTYQEGKKIGFLDGIMAIWIIIKFRFFD